jgi:hypothetical protein
MNYEVIILIFLFLVGVAGVGARFYIVFLGQTERKYRKYEFAKPFLEEVRKTLQCILF